MGAVRLSLGIRDGAQGGGDPTVRPLGSGKATIGFLTIGRDSRRGAGLSSWPWMKRGKV